MRKIGFSTGALSKADFRQALGMLREIEVDVIELSALRIGELDPLLNAIDSLDLSQFTSFISIHAPSNIKVQDEALVVEKLSTVLSRGWPIVVHPDSIHDAQLWQRFGRNLCLENMDKRKPIARTRDELAVWFEQLPDASLCLDLAHVRQIDTTMTEAYRILRDFKNRLREVHLSELSYTCQHERLSMGACIAFQEIAPMIPAEIPIILESVIENVERNCIKGEIKMAREALPLLSLRKGDAAMKSDDLVLLPV
jgi:hypothetical protein